MKLETVQANLRNTIAGKERLLLKDEIRLEEVDMNIVDRMACIAVVKLLKINIDELKRILTDVELCMNDAAANSWAGEVDRQGGSFTDEELDPNRGWK